MRQLHFNNRSSGYRKRVVDPPHRQRRRGAIAVMAAFVLTLVFGLVAFAVDLGYIAATKTGLQSAADGAALSSAIELSDGLGIAPLVSQSDMQTAAKDAAVEVAAKTSNGDQSATYIDPDANIRFGRVTWDNAQATWVKTWGATPANMVEVSTHRDSSSSAGAANGGGPLNLFFGPVLGKNTANISARAVAATLPGVGFKITAGSSQKFGALPIACDLTSWNALIAGSGPDAYSYNSSNETVSSGGDGVRELNIYPDPNANLPAGNRGTVDLGNPNNSTADLMRQIVDGLNESDLSYFPDNTIRTDTGPVILNGDTGISAGIKAQLEAIKGEPRLMPIFTVVGSLQQATTGDMSGKKASGNNVYYRVVKFVGVRIMYVQLTGNNKRVIIQPATFTSPAVISGEIAETADSYFAKPKLIE